MVKSCAADFILGVDVACVSSPGERNILHPEENQRSQCVRTILSNLVMLAKR